jgi:NAD(P)-dependent dehydrogenase (short-subunit alcohol dehydrogenase family)
MTSGFEGRKVVVVGGSSGMAKSTAADVVAGGGSAVVIGRDRGRVDETVAELGKQGPAWGIAADLADRSQVEDVREELAAAHADATLLVNAAGFFIPKPFGYSLAKAGLHALTKNLAIELAPKIRVMTGQGRLAAVPEIVDAALQETGFTTSPAVLARHGRRSRMALLI